MGSGSTWAVNVIIVKHRVPDRRNFPQNNSVKSGSVGGAASNVSLLELHENGTYLSHYVLTSTQKCVYPPDRRQKGIAGHCHICWTPARRLAPSGTNNLPPGSRLRMLSLPYLSPFSCSDKKLFWRTYLYLPINRSFNASNPGPFVSTGSQPHHFLPNVYNNTRRSSSCPRCPPNNA